MTNKTSVDEIEKALEEIEQNFDDKEKSDSARLAKNSLKEYIKRQDQKKKSSRMVGIWNKR